MNLFRDHGCIAFRSAGSHSPIDVCVIDLQHRIIRLIQCKVGEISERQKERMAAALGIEGTFEVQFEVM